MSTSAFITLYGLPFLLIAGALWQRLPASPVPAADAPPRLRTWLWAWIAIGVAIRIPLLWDTGFHYDTGTYKAWALAAADPQRALYGDELYPQTPPLLMYMLALLGSVARWMQWETSTHFTALIKLPALAADLLASLLLFSMAKRRLPEGRALMLASLYWLNPAIIFVGALWGQINGIVAALLLCSAWAWTTSRFTFASILLALASALHPQGALFALLFVVAMLVERPPAQALKAVGIGIISYIALILPALHDRSLSWLLGLYISDGGAAAPWYITANAYNLWSLFGLNWKVDAGSVLGMRTQVFAAVAAALLALALALRTGLALRAEADRHFRESTIAWSWLAAMLGVFMLAPDMRERHLLLAIPLAMMVWPPRTAVLLVTLCTTLALANIGYVYHHYIDLKGIAPQDTPFIRFCSAFSVLLALAVLAHRWKPDGMAHVVNLIRKSVVLQASAGQLAPPEQETWRLRHTGIVFGFLVAALAIGLLRVGTQVYPQSGVVSDGFTVEFRYETPVDARQALIYVGEKAPDSPDYTNKVKLSLERLTDQGEWVSVIAERELPDFYKLYEIALENPGPSHRYRWHTQGQQWRINELGLLDLAGTPLTALEIENTSATDLNAQALIDEPQTWRRGQGYLASTYFDEIYHGRTGYEFLHRLSIYETTHPPLGKWIISFGIDTFGMTPFGWRFMGVLASALTVGALAWGGWLFGRSSAAMLVAGGLGLFEFSRFTIGRYATIDSFLGLFLLLSVLFLWRQFGLRRHDNWRDGWRLSGDLAAAGTFLGAAIAVKWSALYGGIGVFLFFVGSVGSGLLQGEPNRWRDATLRSFGAAIAFGLIPLTVYCFSYTPFLRSLQHAPSLLSIDGLREILRSQRDILDYHAKLTSTHPFSSQFWTWPLNLKPMWIYTGEGQPRTAISILGNPLIWWGGLAVAVAAAWDNLRRARPSELLLFGAIASLYLPWALVDRATFNYHYYPAVLLLIVLMSARIVEWARIARLPNLPALTVLAAGILFSWFYPTISGLPAPMAWFQSLRWLPTWWML